MALVIRRGGVSQPSQNICHNLYHVTTCIFIRTYIHVSADDMVGITKNKKKYLSVLNVNVLLFEIKV